MMSRTFGNYTVSTCIASSVTRLGNFVHFGQLFKAFGNNLFVQISYILRHFCKGVKIYHFSSEIIFGQLLQTFGNFYLVTLIASIVFYHHRAK